MVVSLARAPDRRRDGTRPATWTQVVRHRPDRQDGPACRRYGRDCSVPRKPVHKSGWDACRRGLQHARGQLRANRDLCKRPLRTLARFDLADLGITGTAQGPRGGVTATNVHWHPSGRFIAVNINTQNCVAFFRLKGSTLEPWGNPVTVGVTLSSAVSRPTGATISRRTGAAISPRHHPSRLPEASSSISVVRLADVDAAGAAAQHQRIGGTATDLSAEGIAISPDG